MSNYTRASYPLEFRTSSVKLAVESEQSVAQTARDLGVKTNTLYNWMVKYSDSNQVNQQNMANNGNSFEEIKRLKKELASVKQERDLLKKAAAYFAKESR